MQNAAAVEALYSATYAENFLECMENLPNELQKNISRLREYDFLLHREFLGDLDTLITSFESDHTNAGQRSILAKIQRGLITAQDIGDDKLATVQDIVDTIENKARHLEHDAKNLDFGDEDEVVPSSSSQRSNATTHHKTSSNVHAAGSSGMGSAASGSKKRPSVAGVSGSSTSGGNNEDSKADHKSSAKRRKKAVQGNHQHNQSSSGNNAATGGNADRGNNGSSSGGGGTGNSGSQHDKSSSRGGGGANSAAEDHDDDPPAVTPRAGSKRQGGAGGSSSSSAKKSTGRKKTSKKEQQAPKQDPESDQEIIDLSQIEIDPDEPTYCLCEQVSYGDMIGCDNDLCPIEWFHFQCVQLTSKPKGRWFCPKCRGDKPTIMKPKAQFLKELDKFNKEREEKMSKQSN